MNAPTGSGSPGTQKAGGWLRRRQRKRKRLLRIQLSSAMLLIHNIQPPIGQPFTWVAAPTQVHSPVRVSGQEELKRSGWSLAPV